VADILVVGSIAWDEVVRLDSMLRRGAHNAGAWLGRRIGGGAANTAMSLARAGDRAQVISAVGSDSDGEFLVEELSGVGVDVSAIARDGGETTRAIILLEADGERTVVNLTRARVHLPSDLDRRPADACYVRSADPALTSVLRRRAASGLVISHIPPVTRGLRPAQVLVGSASDLDAEFLADPYWAGRAVAGALLEWVVITRGAEGAAAYGPEDRLELAAPAVDAVDTTGAGDIFAAGLVHALATGQPMEQALGTAVEWGSASVTFEGTVPPEEFPGGLDWDRRRPS
jgi:sugar/nucleoside kinase (ribokinase family)